MTNARKNAMTVKYCKRRKCKHADFAHDGTNHAPGAPKTACKLCMCKEFTSDD